MKCVFNVIDQRVNNLLHDDVIRTFALDVRQHTRYSSSPACAGHGSVERRLAQRPQTPLPGYTQQTERHCGIVAWRTGERQAARQSKAGLVRACRSAS